MKGTPGEMARQPQSKPAGITVLPFATRASMAVVTVLLVLVMGVIAAGGQLKSGPIDVLDTFVFLYLPVKHCLLSFVVVPLTQLALL